VSPTGALYDEEGTVQLAALDIGAERYVVDVMRVEEVIPPPEVVRVASGPSFVEGVFELRGTILPLVDARKRLLGAGEREPGRLVVCKVGGGRFGLLVDRVTAVFRTSRTNLKSAPLTSTAERPYVLGVCHHGGRLYLMLDVKALLADGGPGPAKPSGTGTQGRHGSAEGASRGGASEP
jgi:purine-binding chemotaxis protein CheW